MSSTLDIFSDFFKACYNASMLRIVRLLTIIVIIVASPFFFFLTFQYLSRANAVKARITVETQKSLGAMPDRWKAIAQGGEEKGVRMLANVVPDLAGLYPRSIRIDHIYDYYDVIGRDEKGNLTFDFSLLDETVCDIYHTGAKPFFVLGYMPETLSGDTTLISAPKNWEEWAIAVEKTIEHYSGKDTRLCGQIAGFWMSDLYYEVWNEPDLETFGKWSLYGGSKDYKTLYYYSSLGANRADNVNRFYLGGPVTTAAYQSWIQKFLDFVTEKNIRLDFLSWHHYSKNPGDYAEDMRKMNEWLSPPQYERYRSLPRVISEWGFDSEPNVIADTNIGAAYTISAIRNFINEKYEMAFLFEAKDGPSPRWGILAYDGARKPRYHALRLFNLLSGSQVAVSGEGTYVQAVASQNEKTTVVILVNYDQAEKNTESVPVTVTGLAPGTYSLWIEYLDGNTVKLDELTIPASGTLERNILMTANMVVAVILERVSP